MKEYFHPDTKPAAALPSPEDIASMSITSLRQLLQKLGTKGERQAAATAVEKTDLVTLATSCVQREAAEKSARDGSKYDLAVNVVHELNITQVWVQVKA